MDNQLEYSLNKTIILTILFAFCSILFFCYKVGSCSESKDCKDEFVVVYNNSNSHCTPGAKAEMVTSPAIGLLCHCPGSVTPANSGK